MPIRLNARNYPTLRSIIAAAMMGVYLCIALGPVLPAALHSKSVIHAITGECSGDCDICGCSPASRASHTCCCSRKKEQVAALHHEHDRTDQNLPECCRKPPAPKGTVILSCGCPCGGEKDPAVAAAKAGELLPCYFTAWTDRPCSVTEFTDHPPPLTSRLPEPPDPPPRRA